MLSYLGIFTHFLQVVGDDDGSDSDTDSMGEVDSEMMVDASHANAAPAGMLIDEQAPTKSVGAEDGWTVVGSRKTKGRRK